MSEDRAGDDSRTDERKEKIEPGGGPKRVVSNRSVDDILESLDSTDGAKTNETKDTVSEGTNETNGSVSEREDEGIDEVSAGTDKRIDAVPKEDDECESTRTMSSLDDPNERKCDRDDEDSDDVSAPSDDETLEARIDAGTVTGADVRAAESGDDREATPEIDEIDLSLEDIDASPTGHHEPTDETDGPLAGRIGTSADSSIGPSHNGEIEDEPTAEVRTESETRELRELRDGDTSGSQDGDRRQSQEEDRRESQDDKPTGFLDRLRRLF